MTTAYTHLPFVHMLAAINREAIEKRASKLGLPVYFHDGIDHMKLTQYSVFVNPSVSEVLCTTIAEVTYHSALITLSTYSCNHCYLAWLHTHRYQNWPYALCSMLLLL
jgi:digalactosyldiacylglycerol synthase